MVSMHRASDLRTGGLRRGALVVAALAFTLVLASLVSWRLGAPPSEPAGALDEAQGLWPIALAWLALALVLACVAALGGATLARQRADRELRAARLDRQTLVELLDVWQWQTDDAHRLLRLTPPAAASPASWSAAQEPPAPAWERFDAGTPPPGPLRERLCAKVSIVDLHVTRREVDGTTSRWLLRGAPRFDGRGRFIGYLGTARPLEAGRDAAPMQAPPVDDASDAAREQEAFSYTVSHDLRAPLRVVDGFARILKEDYGGALDKTGHDHLDRVLGAAARMNSMIDALLNLSQLSSRPLVRQPVNLSQLAGFVVDDLRRSAPERRVDVHIEPGMTAQGDPTLLRMALENLLGNAWKYTARTAEPRIGFERTEHEGGCAYTVHDNGAGFDMRFADRLFGVFQRLHSASDFEGTGVGLASVRRIVQRHRGEIWAESEVGRGARFHFTLRA